MIELAFLAPWGALCWVLRGGLFGAVVRRTIGIEPGTTVTRIATMGALVAPFAFLGLVSWQVAAALWVTCYVASTQGYFGEGMGIERGWRDVVLMSLWGVTVFWLAALGVTAAVGFLVDPLTAVLVVRLTDLPWVLCGAIAGPGYAINKRFGRRFGTDWTERAEATVGAALAVALWGVVA